jgi:accessory gene regulator protein AgrB
LEQEIATNNKINLKKPLLILYYYFRIASSKYKSSLQFQRYQWKKKHQSKVLWTILNSAFVFSTKTTRKTTIVLKDFISILYLNPVSNFLSKKFYGI